MPTVHRTALANGVTLRAAGEGDLVARGCLGELTVHRPSSSLSTALHALAGAGATDDQLESLAGDDALLLYYHLEALSALGLLSWTVAHDDVLLATLTPISPRFVRPVAGVDAERVYRLSRFASARAGDRDAGMIVECPLSLAAVTLHDPRAASLLFELMRPFRPSELANRTGSLDGEPARAVVQLLADAAMLTPEAPEEAPRSPAEVALLQWEVHDLAFHARSRVGRHLAPCGATYRFEGSVPSTPALKGPMSEALITLERPDLEALCRSDAPFTAVLERRRTVHGRGSTPLTLRQLGDLLFRAARVRGLRPSALGDATDRPYPGAGALYELEIYPVVNACDGLDAGMYHYCPANHRLERLASEANDVRALIEGARGPEWAPELPEVLLVIAARFQRVSWKYESIAYSLILKDVGVLLQTMYLVATAMSLSPRALGGGDSDLFARAAGTDYYVEASVGELALGGAGGP
jgi:SagB-type dehydrogenase family enzyme